MRISGSRTVPGGRNGLRERYGPPGPGRPYGRACFLHRRLPVAAGGSRWQPVAAGDCRRLPVTVGGYSGGSTPARSSPYVYASSRACQDAAITLSATPTVDHSPMPSEVEISTRVVEFVPCLPSRMRTL